MKFPFTPKSKNTSFFDQEFNEYANFVVSSANNHCQEPIVIVWKI